MKKLIILIGIILFSITSYSQKVDSVICIPVNVAKQIAVDLTTGDMTADLLYIADKKIESLEAQVKSQDVVIKDGIKIETSLVWQLNNQKEISKEYSDLYNREHAANKSLYKKYKWTKFKSKLKSAIGIPVVLGLTALYILK